MASRQPRLNVIVSPDAQADLKAIYAYNAKHRSPSQADSYEDFLVEGIAQLSTSHDEGKPVPGFTALKSLTLRRTRGGDGHIVIYEYRESDQTVMVYHIYHTKMDIKGRLRQDLA